MTTGERIREARKEQGLTQRELASRTGIAEITVRNYEAGKCVPKFDRIEKLAVALKTTADYLLCLTDKVILSFDDINALISSINRFHDKAKQFFGDTSEGEEACNEAMIYFFSDISRVITTYNKLFDNVTDAYTSKEYIKRVEASASPYSIDDMMKSIYNAQTKDGESNAPKDEQ